MTARLVGQAIQALVEEGPALGRPLVDRVKGAELHNLKNYGRDQAGPVRFAFCSPSTLGATRFSWSPETRQGSGPGGTSGPFQ